MSSHPKKYSVRLSGHATSLTLEPPFWEELDRIAKDQGRSRQNLIEDIDRKRESNLSSTLRVFVLHTLRQKQG